MNKASREGTKLNTQKRIDPALEALCMNTSFPLEHEAITDLARDQNMEPNLMERLETMPRRTYNTLEEFRQAFTEDLEDYGGVKEKPRTPPPTF